MTPERIKQLARIQASRNRPYYPDETVEVLGDEWCALLTIAQRAGETCEWVLDAAGRYAKISCDAIRVEVDGQPIGNRPCWCGRTVVVRDGRT